MNINMSAIADSLNSESQIGFIYYLVILIPLLISLFAFRREGWLTNLRNLGIWLLIFLVLIIAYAYKQDLTQVKDRVASVLLPGRSYSSDNYIIVNKANDRHYYLDVELNGETIRFLVDTGASEVTLSANDAAKLRINYDDNYRIFSTANGRMRAYEAYGDFAVSGLKVNNFRFFVSESENNVSLLGMSFLKLFDEVKFDNDRLYLKLPQG
jgi:aspartyl protease family protein